MREDHEPDHDRDNATRSEEHGLRLVTTGPREAEDENSPRDERRQREDRRLEPTRSWHSLLGFHRRRRGRRLGERDNIYVDSYTRHDVALMLGVFVLNILDAFFTLRWLGMGGSEGNPLMDALIRTSDMIFVLQKCLVVGLWLLILVIHKNFRIARVGLWVGLILYAGILFYHFFLQGIGPAPMPHPPS